MLSRECIVSILTEDLKLRTLHQTDKIKEICSELISDIVDFPTDDSTAEETFNRAFSAKRLKVLLGIEDCNELALTVALPKKGINTEEILKNGFSLQIIDGGAHFEISTTSLHSHGGYRD